MMPVYDGPGTHYRRAANGKAAVSTNGRVYIAGWENGWLMLMYHPTDKSNVRVGFASSQSFSDQIYAPSLGFDYLHTTTTGQVQLLEDPIVTHTPISWLNEGTPVIWLSRFFHPECRLGVCRGQHQWPASPGLFTTGQRGPEQYGIGQYEQQINCIQ
jgi:hypothetical protein